MGSSSAMMLASLVWARLSAGPAESPDSGSEAVASRHAPNAAAESKDATPRSRAAEHYALGSAAYNASNFARCVEELERALELGTLEPPPDVRMLDLRLSLG